MGNRKKILIAALCLLAGLSGKAQKWEKIGDVPTVHAHDVVSYRLSEMKK